MPYTIMAKREEFNWQELRVSGSLHGWCWASGLVVSATIKSLIIRDFQNSFWQITGGRREPSEMECGRWGVYLPEM